MIELISAGIQLCTALVEFTSTALTVKNAETYGRTIKIINYNLIQTDYGNSRFPDRSTQHKIGMLGFVAGIIFLSWLYLSSGELLYVLAVLANEILLVQSWAVKRQNYLIGNLNGRAAAIILLPTIQAMLEYFYKTAFGLHGYTSVFSSPMGLSDYISAIFQWTFSIRELMYLILAADMALFYVIYISYALLLVDLINSVCDGGFPSAKSRMLLGGGILGCYVPSLIACVIIYLQWSLKFVR